MALVTMSTHCTLEKVGCSGVLGTMIKVDCSGVLGTVIKVDCDKG